MAPEVQPSPSSLPPPLTGAGRRRHCRCRRVGGEGGDSEELGGGRGEREGERERGVEVEHAREETKEVECALPVEPERETVGEAGEREWLGGRRRHEREVRRRELLEGVVQVPCRHVLRRRLSASSEVEMPRYQAADGGVLFALSLGMMPGTQVPRSDI
uniref:Uncharacterized protein n=1 Tax=Oryza glumipatula TaxID=40148 RepID=A0A0D9Z1F8_9ORYZ